ncbi:uncharacterized membrane protein HdeD (DUF308 family) [Silvibacterium bohemicum]|uniref:Uncharacterized membrane protein HdeD (DUF308 family) n=1 Tax=Silvibacterium bohemicum TaxID=1577686 RepID=A0A841K9M4_9BACT|nr:hypothetical protein [Silvibacterium bohemicum]MBB6147258.1 uncharacterized membrane protein HdeD (DUF308 family) [Silvibacterium bohemicum]
MLNDVKIRTAVLSFHGALAFILGSAFVYLGATMTNLFFEAVSVAIALVLAMAALILAGISDWFAALGEGPRRMHRFIFYMMSGTILAGTGVVLGYSPLIATRWLLVAAAIYACVFGIFSIVSATGPGNQLSRHYSVYLFGPASIAFSGILAACAVDDVGNSLATAILGTYLCFVGLKMFVFAWKMDSVAWEAQQRVYADGGRSMPADSSSPRKVTPVRLREKQRSP